ncbi:NB-ARC domain-containing protein [Actinoplanes sp. KI2]|uniref:AfsR/SARP family transcriptional regulator n=1 Tax=Actinoplanes sp. KI2 TaxID=2983315 RepID=UPI0021D5CC5B|nr:BTAD domain-containing putative transcriptional regulator [Actinoplanes sp. KI2]MCU7728897.1 NB-ARC domain-containing protein [Actinoplanes sp. KI2]
MEVLADGERIAMGGPRQRVVLAMLLLAPNRIVSIDRLTEAVWNGNPPATSRTQLAICVAGLRKVFQAAGCPDDVIVTMPPGYMLNTGQHTVDAVEFAESVNTAQLLVHHRRSAEAAEHLRTALALWRGGVLDDVSSAVIQHEASALDKQRLTAYEEYATLQLGLGRHREVVTELSTLVQDQPLWEHARAALMVAHYRSGRRSDALRVFREAREVFSTELGLEPSRELQDLHTAILQESPDLLSAPVRAGRVWAEAAEALLPPVPSSFVGRTAELAALDRLLDVRSAGSGPGSGPTVGLVVGRPGVGKTALVTHWANRVANSFPDGQLYADVAENPDPEAVLEQFLGALGVDAAEAPDRFADRVALFQRATASRQILVVLDGVGSPAQIKSLVPAGRGSCLVLTSRRMHAMHTQVRLRVDALPSAAAVSLLEQLIDENRVGADRAAARQVAELCGGEPVALRAAAARLVTKSHWRLGHLIQRLRDERHRLDELSHGQPGMRAVLESGYRSLTPEAASMYRHLGLLSAAELDARAAAALLATSVDRAESLLEELVDAALLEADAQGADGVFRYRVPTLLALHARERLENEESLGRRDEARQRLRVHHDCVAAPAGRP